MDDTPNDSTNPEVVTDNASTNSVEVVAKEVLSGMWGRGQDRKRRLSEAGFDAGEVQREVNRITKGE